MPPEKTSFDYRKEIREFKTAHRKEEVVHTKSTYKKHKALKLKKRRGAATSPDKRLLENKELKPGSSFGKSSRILRFHIVPLRDPK